MDSRAAARIQGAGDRQAGSQTHQSSFGPRAQRAAAHNGPKTSPAGPSGSGAQAGAGNRGQS
ncbi:MAG: hypothetical protein EBS05_24470 [Proteobacteria bacterium]|nr:hypothetical protein [Pseudomonadota bacterium]